MILIRIIGIDESRLYDKAACGLYIIIRFIILLIIGMKTSFS